ncbi:hypothetical protein Dimus_030690, partial [Dionaea muscipula]
AHRSVLTIRHRSGRDYCPPSSAFLCRSRRWMWPTTEEEEISKEREEREIKRGRERDE